VFIGAVHDFGSLTASVRHGARSLAEIAREHLGGSAGHAFLLFIWIALLYVVVAFADITAGTFVAGTEDLQQGNVTFNAGGAVAAASIMYLLLAVIMGLVERWMKPPLWLLTLIFVPATFAVAWGGTQVSHWFVLSHHTWALLILLYCGVASVVPVWALLQPRGYLGGFVLYTALAAGVIGILFGGYAVVQPAWKAWNTGTPTGMLFPFLFVTIACGACSGFHGLVCSGTTSKQVARESHLRPVGYGAMLAEGFVALIALVTIMIASSDSVKGLAPGTIYGNGIGRFMTVVIGKDQLAFATTFGAMAFSTFVFDTLDVCTRLGRYILQELLGWRSRTSAAVATLVFIAVPAYILLTTGAGGWAKFWILFGASNQLLAALTLITLTVWLRRSGKPFLFVLIPMVFVLVITLWALVQLLVVNVRAAAGGSAAILNACAAAAFIVLALFLASRAWRVRAQSS